MDLMRGGDVGLGADKGWYASDCAAVGCRGAFGGSAGAGSGGAGEASGIACRDQAADAGDGRRGQVAEWIASAFALAATVQRAAEAEGGLTPEEYRALSRFERASRQITAC